MTNCYENVRGGGCQVTLVMQCQKYLVECFSFSFSDECSVVPDAFNLFNKFLTTYCMFKEIEN